MLNFQSFLLWLNIPFSYPFTNNAKLVQKQLYILTAGASRQGAFPVDGIQVHFS
jgi:hypothetical protein